MLQVKVSFQSAIVTIMEDKEAIGLESLLGALGGMLNLWIGISFVTVIEIIDVIFKIILGLTSRKRVSDEKSDK